MKDLEFIDVAILKKIDDETTVENFGSKINSTFFEAANLLGNLKVKGYIDIHSSIGNSPVIISEKGRLLIKELDVFSQDALSRFDLAVLGNVKGGVKDPGQIEELLNTTSRDVAFSLYRLWSKGLVEYFVRNGRVEVRLTSQGFEHNSPEVNAQAARVMMRTSQGVKNVNAPSEVKNKVAEELASADITIEKNVSVPLHSRIIANILYYKWYVGILLLILLISILFFIK